MFLRLFPRYEEYRSGSDVLRGMRVGTLSTNGHLKVRADCGAARFEAVKLPRLIDQAPNQRISTNHILNLLTTQAQCDLTCDSSHVHFGPSRFRRARTCAGPCKIAG